MQKTKKEKQKKTFIEEKCQSTNPPQKLEVDLMKVIVLKALWFARI